MLHRLPVVLAITPVGSGSRAAFAVVVDMLVELVYRFACASIFHQRQMRTLRASVVILKVTVAD